jgi:hypothetical protein
MTTKLFLDTEFTGLHQNTTLISLALVAETGEEFYAEFTDYDQSQVDLWIETHVVSHRILDWRQLALQNKLLDGKATIYGDKYIVNGATIYGDKYHIESILREWLTRFTSCELWGDVLSYDFVLFCQLFGGALNLPKNVFYIPFDLATVFRVVGINPDVSREDFATAGGWKDDLPKHNALHDARVQLECYRILAEAGKQSARLHELRLEL